jgi:hypothetical protein
MAARMAPRTGKPASEVATLPAWSGAKPPGQQEPPGVWNLCDMVRIARRPDGQRQPALYAQVLTYLYQFQSMVGPPVKRLFCQKK